MKTTNKLWKRLLGTGVFFFMLLCLSLVPVSAQVYVPKSVTVTLYSAKDKNLGYTLSTSTDTTKNSNYLVSVDGKISSLKSGNTSIATVSTKKFDGVDATFIYVKGRKAGTTYVSFKQGSKTYKTKVIVKKHTCPVSYITVGSKKLAASKFKTYSNCTLKYADYLNKKTKITVKPASGWILTGIEYAKKGWMKSEMIKNGGYVKPAGGKGYTIIAYLYNEKTDQSETINIFLK